jgi:hypothetical protein
MIKLWWLLPIALALAACARPWYAYIPMCIVC